MSMYFDNLAQATVEDRVVVNKLTTAKITPTEQAALYTNPLSTKEADNVALQTAMKKLKMEVKTSAPKLPPSIGQATSRGASTTKHKRGRPYPKWKREGQSTHPTWWSTSYCWSHGAGGHSGAEFKRKKPDHKTRANARKGSGGTTFGLSQDL